MAARRIGEILVSARACTPEAVREALQNQVIFGGRLGTNLLEIGAVREDALAAALGERHRLPSLGGDQRLDPQALELVTPEMADRYDIVPYFLAGARLAVLACDPSDLHMLDEVAFVTGKQIHPFVAPEARIWALLRRAYGIERNLRGIDVEWARLARPGEAGAAASAASAAKARGGELTSEAEFEAMYAGGGAGEPPAEDPIVDLTDLVLEPAPEPGSESPLEAGVPELRDDAFQPLSAPLATAPAALLETLARAPGHAAPAGFVPAATPRRVEPEATPLRFDEAVRSLDGVGDRGAIARTVLRYARTKFRRALLLTVNRGSAQGWAGLGEKLDPEAAARVRIALGSPGIVDTVVATRAHYLGPIPKTEANVRLLKQLGGGVPGNAFLVPILALGRVVNVFYADNGRGAVVDASDLGELLILASRIAQSYDTLVRRAA